MVNRNTILLFIIFLAAVIYFGYLVPEKSGLQVGDQAPEFTLVDEQGAEVKLSDFRGQTVLLNFWATWCPPCIWEMPSLEHLYQVLKSDDFTVLAVSIDEGGWKAIKSFQKEVSVTFPILLDTTGRAAESYGSYQLPESYLIDGKGVILKKYLGPLEWNKTQVVSEIKRLRAGEGS